MTAAAALLCDEEPAVAGAGGDHHQRRTVLNDSAIVLNNNNNDTQPAWLEDETVLQGERLAVPEWDHAATSTSDGESNTTTDCYRRKHGWLGRDLVHDRRAPVRITDYFVRYGSGADLPSLVAAAAVAADADDPQSSSPHGGGGAGTTLTGIVQFTEAAESHAGLCHGGSMCSVVDDCVGWTAFCVTGACRPWTGFTVQINTALRRAVPVHSTLAVQGRVTAVERRKVSVSVTLYDPAAGTVDDAEAVHAVGEGLVVLNRGIWKTIEE